MSILARIAARMSDSTERELFLAQQQAGDEYEAAVSGAYHASAIGEAAADARYYAAHREYDRASAALIEYRRTHGTSMVTA